MKKSTIAAALIGLIALAGCAKVRYPDYYVLNLPNPVSAPRESRPIPASVAVREFRAPQYLRQGSIVYRPEAERVAFYDFHRWAEDPRQTVTLAMLRDLRQVFESAELYDGRASAEFLLIGSLDRLEEVDAGRSISVEVGISAKLQNVKTGQTMWSGAASQKSEVDQRSLSGVVAEMSRDLSEAATQLVSSMRAQLAQKSSDGNND